MDREKIVWVKDLIKSFDGQRVIDKVNFSLFRGENLVLLGKSGTGKSVIMKCLVRLLEPDSGEIKVLGTDMVNCNEAELAHVRSQIGYLFQEGALYDSMSIKENLLFPALRNHKTNKLGIKELERLVKQNLENVGLLDAINKMPSELSGGMKKRAGLARTLMLSPELIIYDEPTTGLDPYTSDSINKLIVKIQKDYNTSSIIITHDIKCAEITSDRVIVIHDGMVFTEGLFTELKKQKEKEVQIFFN